jgi:hypothetical protein
MKHSERFALNQWLSDYPEDMTYANVIRLMRDDESWTHESISVWQVVEHFSLRQVADFIEDTRCAVENMMEDLVYAVSLRDKTEEESLEEGITA